MTTKNRVTIVDVAREAGVSPGTVSRTLNHRGGDIKISEPTRQLVLDAVERLGYKRNPFASALRTRRTGVMGAVVRDVGDSFLSLVARKLQQAAHQRGVELLLGHAGYDVGTAVRQVTVMSEWLDGLFIIGDILGDHSIIERLTERGTPYVAIACGQVAAPPSVNIDEQAATLLSLDYLRSLGHKRIAFIGSTELVGIRERHETFQQFVAQHGLYWREEYLQTCPNSRSTGVAAVRRLLELDQPPSAIFCGSDLLALGALAGAQQMGWNVPQSLSIIGFDDIEEASESVPALTTIRQPVGDMAYEAMELMNRLTTEPPPEAIDEMKVVVTPMLVVRASCAPPAR